MNTKIFVNLVVKDLERTKDFFAELGYSFNKQFTDQNAACLVISDDIYAMLVTEPFFKQLTKTTASWNRQGGTECTVALSMESREAVDKWAEKALKAGATENIVPEMQTPDGSMYGKSLNDLDGHIWEVFWMDPKSIQK